MCRRGGGGVVSVTWRTNEQDRRKDRIIGSLSMQAHQAKSMHGSRSTVTCALAADCLHAFMGEETRTPVGGSLSVDGGNVHAVFVRMVEA